MKLASGCFCFACLFLSFFKAGGYSVRCWVAVCHRIPYQRHIPLRLILREHDPRALKCFAFTILDQQELFNVTWNALFCILPVWQDFIRLVVLRLLSRGTNNSSKHIRNYTQDGLVNFRFKFERRGRNEPIRLNVFCCEAETLRLITCKEKSEVP